MGSRVNRIMIGYATRRFTFFDPHLFSLLTQLPERSQKRGRERLAAVLVFAARSGDAVRHSDLRRVAAALHARGVDVGLGRVLWPAGWLDKAARREQYMLPRRCGTAGVDSLDLDALRLDQNQSVLWALHWAALGDLCAAGRSAFFSRPVAFVSWLITISYVQRNPQAMFGLDGINTMLSMYLWIGPCGACYLGRCVVETKEEQGRGGTAAGNRYRAASPD